MTDPFVELHDNLVHAIAHLQTRPVRARRGLRIRSHPLAAVAAALVFAATATAAVISVTSEGSAPLTGRVPAQAGPGSAREWGLEAGERYRFTVWPVLQGGVSGVCTMIVFEGAHGQGQGSCGESYPTTAMPYLGPGGRVAYPRGIITRGGALEYLLTGPAVASVRIGTHLVITPRRERGLPEGDRAVVFYLPAGSPELDPPGYPAGQLSLPPGASTLSVVALGRDGAPIPLDQGTRPFHLPARYWERPDRPPHGACALAAPRGYVAVRGTTAVDLRAEPQAEGAALTSCLSVDYQLAGSTLTAAVLVNARSPLRAPPALFGASPLAGEPGIVNREENTGLHAGTRIAFTARRDGNAWIVVEGGHGLTQRIRALRSLHIARIEVSAAPRVDPTTDRRVNPTASAAPHDAARQPVTGRAGRVTKHVWLPTRPQARAPRT